MREQLRSKPSSLRGLERATCEARLGAWFFDPKNRLKEGGQIHINVFSAGGPTIHLLPIEWSSCLPSFCDWQKQDTVMRPGIPGHLDPHFLRTAPPWPFLSVAQIPPVMHHQTLCIWGPELSSFNPFLFPLQLSLFRPL